MLVAAYYLGLTVFALNGLVMMGQRNLARDARMRDERLRRLLLRRKH
jgi:ferritin-like protein